MALDIWIGLARVCPYMGNDLLGNAAGAFVPVLGLATDPDDLAAAAATLFSHHDFEVVEIEDIEPLAQRLKHYAVEPELLKAGASLHRNNRIAIGAFETYYSDE